MKTKTKTKSQNGNHGPFDSSVQKIKLALNRKEAAVALGMSPATIDRLTKRKLLKPCRASRRPIYAVSEIERFLKNSTGKAA